MFKFWSVDQIYSLLNRRNNILLYLALTFIGSLGIVIYSLVISVDSSGKGLDSLILFVLIAFISIFITILLIVLRTIKVRGKANTNSLKQEIILIISTITSIPIMLVCLFSVYFFIFGIQTWFNNKVINILDSSIKIGEAYVEENKLQLKNHAITLAQEISHIYKELISDPIFFQKVLNVYAEMHGLDEAILFQASTKTLLAQSRFSYSFIFDIYPAEEIEKARYGEIVVLPTPKDRIRYIIKLKGDDEIYLIVGKMILDEIMEYIEKSQSEAYIFNTLKNNIGKIQINFILVFIIISVVIILLAIYIAIIFANKILTPINNLIHALKSVKQGDFSTTVQLTQSQNEINILSKGFNDMVTTLDIQRKDLLLAQKSLVWSEVARRVAHEIKNPLTPMQLAANRLKNKFSKQIYEDKDKFNRYADTIIRHVDDISKIICEFVNFVRMPTPKLLKCNIVNLLSEIINLRKILNEDISYSLYSTRKNIEFICDSNQLNQIMINLLKNAEEALANVDVKRITVIVLKNSNNIVIMVNDTGKGFNLDLLKTAITPYVSSKSDGMGLGLSIVDKIMNEHDGSIEISNLATGGASIKLIFNLKLLQQKLIKC